MPRRSRRQRFDAVHRRAREIYLGTYFRRDTPIPLPSCGGLPMSRVPLEVVESLTLVSHRQLAALAVHEMDLRHVGAGC